MSVYLYVLVCDKADVTTEQLTSNHLQIESHLQLMDTYHADWVEIFGSYTPLSFRPSLVATLGVELESEGGSVGSVFASTAPDFASALLEALIKINRRVDELQSSLGLGSPDSIRFDIGAHIRLGKLLAYMWQKATTGKHVVLCWS